ncbi:MAG: hypothetical protein ACREF1_11795 [Acetobacteraceae bacterium]
MKEFTVEGFVAKLSELAIAVHQAEHAALEAAVRVVEIESKAEVGYYQEAAGPLGERPDLKARTREDKQHLGRMSDPCYSIERTVLGDEAHVGSDSEIATYQELGTAHIPPGNFLGGALVQKTDDVARIVSDGVVGALIGQEDRRGVRATHG